MPGYFGRYWVILLLIFIILIILDDLLIEKLPFTFNIAFLIYHLTLFRVMFILNFISFVGYISILD